MALRWEMDGDSMFSCESSITFTFYQFLLLVPYETIQKKALIIRGLCR